MEAKRRPQPLTLSLLLGLIVGGCDGMVDPQPQGLTYEQVAGTYALQTYNGEPLPRVLHTWAGEFDDGGRNPPTPITIDVNGVLTLGGVPFAFQGPKDPPGTYKASPPGQISYDPYGSPNGARPFYGSVVIHADGTCGIQAWEDWTPGSCRLTQHLLEWTAASLVLEEAGLWTATRTHRAEFGSSATYTGPGTFSIHGTQIVFAPGLPPSSPGCTTIATLTDEVLTAVPQCQGIPRPGETSVWNR